MSKTLVVSGGTRGIGRAIVEEFASNGVDIAFTYHSNVQIAEDMIAELSERYGVKLKAYHLDILEPDSYKDLFKEIDKDFERIDYFISNAMISGRSVVGGFASFMRLKSKLNHFIKFKIFGNKLKSGYLLITIINF